MHTYFCYLLRLNLAICLECSPTIEAEHFLQPWQRFIGFLPSVRKGKHKFEVFKSFICTLLQEVCQACMMTCHQSAYCGYKYGRQDGLGGPGGLGSCQAPFQNELLHRLAFEGPLLWHCHHDKLALGIIWFWYSGAVWRQSKCAHVFSSGALHRLAFGDVFSSGPCGHDNPAPGVVCLIISYPQSHDDALPEHSQSSVFLPEALFDTKACLDWLISSRRQSSDFICHQ